MGERNSTQCSLCKKVAVKGPAPDVARLDRFTRGRFFDYRKQNGIHSMSRAVVVIVTYNSAAELLGRLSELTEIACDEWFDLVLVDNNSEDNTLEVCDLITEANIVANKENVGFAKAVNQGLRYVSGHQYFVLLNPDLAIEVGSLRKVIRYLDDNPLISICSPTIVNEDGTPQGFWAVNSGLVSLLVHDITLSLYKYVGWMRRRYGTLDGSDVDIELNPGLIGGACFTARSDLLDVVGFFDERFFLYYEETDWCRRATDASCRLAIVPGVKAVHKTHGSAVTRENSWSMLCRSRYIFIRKHYGFLGEYAVRVADLASGLVRWVLASILQVVAGQRTSIDFNRARAMGKVTALASVRSVSK